MAAEGSLITPELMDLLGKETPPLSFEVEKGLIKRFAEAVGDLNPLWTDMEYARKSRYGSIISPPMYLIDPAIVPLSDKIIALKGFPNFINGGTEIEYFKPIRVGDTITTTARLVDVKEKVGSSGRLLIMVLEMTYRNQFGELARKCRNTFIRVQG